MWTCCPECPLLRQWHGQCAQERPGAHGFRVGVGFRVSAIKLWCARCTLTSLWSGIEWLMLAVLPWNTDIKLDVVHAAHFD